jgi:transposase
LEQYAEFLLTLIEDEPDLTLDEVLSAMREHKIPGSRTAVWRFFQRHKITFKKSAARGGTMRCLCQRTRLCRLAPPCAEADVDR